MTALANRVRGPVYVQIDAGFAAELAAFNLAIEHTPDLVVGVMDETDVVEAVRYAREQRIQIAVQGAGHGAYHAIRHGLAITTKRLDHVHIDPATRIATIGAGTQWGTVVAAAAQHGLAPVTGSSPTVGVVGFLLGGGIGPLARSHGFSSDYLVGARIVTGAGELVEVDESHELLWLLRGGKYAPGVITEVRVRLVPLATMYAGSIVFADVETVLRRWLAWTHTADPRVTTSVALGRNPDLPEIPPVLRGQFTLTLRFAFPGDIAEGERLAAPLRALAPILLDRLAEMPAADVAKISNDPTGPVIVWTSGNTATHADDALASIVLEHFGEAAAAPFVGFEMRHVGVATERDVAGGSAVGGRAGRYLFGMVGVDHALFAEEMPEAAERFFAAAAAYLAREPNINFMGPPHTPEHHASAWSPATRARLDELRRRYDPDQLMR